MRIRELIEQRRDAGARARAGAAAFRRLRRRAQRVRGDQRTTETANDTNGIHHRAAAGHRLRAAHAAAHAGIHRRRAADAGARHRRQQRDLQRRARRAARVAAVSATPSGCTRSACSIRTARVLRALGARLHERAGGESRLRAGRGLHRRACSRCSAPASRARFDGARRQRRPVRDARPAGRARPRIPAGGEPAGARRRAVLEHGFWQRVFGGDRNVLGRTVTIGGSAVHDRRRAGARRAAAGSTPTCTCRSSTTRRSARRPRPARRSEFLACSGARGRASSAARDRRRPAARRHAAAERVSRHQRRPDVHEHAAARR